jgi:Flp pilus assembly protein TadG
VAVDDGATATELVVVFPAVLGFVLLAFQFGLYLHAAQIAEAGAQEAVEAAQGEHSGAEAGEAAARALLSGLGALRSPRVEVTRSPSRVTARITGSAQRLIPGAPVAVTATAEGPVERFVPDAGP